MDDVTVALWNAALVGHLGQAALIGPDDDSPTADKVRACWDITRRAVLRSYPWNSAMRRAVLPRNADAPAWGYANAYPLPPDCLLVWEVNGQRQGRGAWSVEDGQILTDLAPPLRVRYVADIPVHRMDAGLQSLCALELAVMLAQPVTANVELGNRLIAGLPRARAEVRGTDAREGNQTQSYDRDDIGDWLDVRR